MAKNIKIDELKNFKAQVEASLSDEVIDAFIRSCVKELAARLLRKVIKRTPVGQYKKGSGKVGGTLRRGWTGGQSSNVTSYVESLKVHHYGGTYVIEITNPVHYGPYVEFGHRTRGGNGWVKGKFMLTISEQEIQAGARTILENKLKKKLGEIFNDNK